MDLRIFKTILHGRNAHKLNNQLQYATGADAKGGCHGGLDPPPPNVRHNFCEKL